jgi:hypothetical protein
MSSLDARQSDASGAGIGGGTAGTEARFTVFAADASGARARSGGAAVVVAVTPSGGVSGGDAIAGAVDDLGDGTYACSYVVPSRGDYDVAVTLDGDAIRGSPFPVFFAAPPASNVPANPMTASAVAGVAAARPPTAAAVLQPATRYPPPPPPPAALDEMQRTLCVKNIGAMVGVEQLRALFGYCGDVVDCRVAGSGAQYGFVEFATNAQAVKALGLDGMALGDRTIKVEMSRTVRMNAPAAPPRGPNLVVPPPPPTTTTTGGAAPTAPAAAAASDAHQKRLADAEKAQAALLAKMAAERAAKVAAKVAAKKRAREAEAAEREDGGGGEVKVPREVDEATRPEKPEDDADGGSVKRSRGGEGDER